MTEILTRLELRLYGRLGDIIGRRWATLLAITLFTIGTALCAFAPSLSALIAGRMVRLLI